MKTSIEKLLLLKLRKDFLIFSLGKISSSEIPFDFFFGSYFNIFSCQILVLFSLKIFRKKISFKNPSKPFLFFESLLEGFFFERIHPYRNYFERMFFYQKPKRFFSPFQTNWEDFFFLINHWKYIYNIIILILNIKYSFLNLF